MNAVAQKEQNNQSVTDKAPAELTFLCPEVNIYESPTGYVLEAEMPGVSKDQLEVTMEGSSLTIVGHRRDALPKAEVLYRESKPAGFRRVFELDPAIDTANIQAHMNQGVLTLELPKAEQVKPRRIRVE